MSDLDVLLTELCQRGRRAAVRRDAHQTGRSLVECRDDIAIVTPARSGWIAVYVAQRHGRAALDRDLLQFSVREKSNPLAIRREEGPPRIVGPGDRNELAIVE